MLTIRPNLRARIVVDEDVDRARLFDQRRAPLFGGLVRRDEVDRAPLIPQRGGRALQLGGIAAIEDHAAPLAGQRLGARQPQPLRRCAEQRDTAVQLQIHGYPFPRVN